MVSAALQDRAYYEQKFFDWLQEHSVKPADGSRFAHFLNNFIENDDFIATHNARKGVTYQLGHNQFSHMSTDEWRQYVRLGLSAPSPDTVADSVHAAPADVSALPSSVDWRSKGAVTGVKDQGQCGSCWSFSTTGALEGAYQIKYSNLVSFSEQNLVDCDTRSGNPKGKDMGCNGGLMDNAFAWTKANGGICTEAAYPYVSGTTKTGGTCTQSKCTVDKNVAPKAFTDVTKNSDSAMMSALAQQPVSIAIEADQKAFQLYKSGVFTEACGTNLDHGVLAVGYGTDAANGGDYYIVKNSWGTSWGDAGFIKLGRGSQYNSGAGQCGMLGAASYPNL